MSLHNANDDARMMQQEEDDIEMDVVDSEDELDEDEDEMNDEEPPEEQPPTAEEDAAIARRRSIQQIMRDTTLSDQEKRMRIQNLMSGGRTVVAPPPAPVLASASGGGAEASAACVHYERNCNIVAPCCQRVFGCRICHDELSDTEHPPMNRFLIQQVVCKNCNTQQAVSNQCINCQTVFGEYFCGVCNLWMSMVRLKFLWKWIFFFELNCWIGWNCSQSLTLANCYCHRHTVQETLSLRSVRILPRRGRRILPTLQRVLHVHFRLRL